MPAVRELTIYFVHLKAVGAAVLVLGDKKNPSLSKKNPLRKTGSSDIFEY
jgi:hypothetical protein